MHAALAVHLAKVRGLPDAIVAQIDVIDLEAPLGPSLRFAFLKPMKTRLPED